MTNPATKSPRNTVSPIVYRLPLDNTEATTEFDYQGTKARILEDFPGYAFTEDGRALSLRYREPLALKPGSSAAGCYCYVNIGRRPLKKSQLLHILVARAWIPNPQSKPQVNHIDGNPRNNAVSNLEWVTPSENVRHANTLRKLQGRSLIKATPEQRTQIVELHAGGMTIANIARLQALPYDYVRHTINSAKKRAAQAA
ncbi:MAG: HNH endonuclease [Pseudomonadales bacterium]|nr:HNH endonuclease [Pseudomonadales bacterium]